MITRKIETTVIDNLYFGGNLTIWKDGETTYIRFNDALDYAIPRLNHEEVKALITILTTHLERMNNENH